MRILYRVFVIGLLSAARICVCSISAPTQNIDDLIPWVLETGTRAPLRKNVATVMGVAAHDITIVERGFRIRGETITHVVGVWPGDGPAGVRLYFFARVLEQDGSAIFWLSTPSGKLERTIFIDPSEGVQLLSNEDQLGEFLSEREYFRRKMRELAPR